MDNETASALIDAIIVQAAEDYGNAYMGYEIDQQAPSYMMADCEKFFRSDYYKSMTTLDGETLILKIKIHELDKVIEAYKEALSVSRNSIYKLFITKKKITNPETGKTITKPSIIFKIPPRLEKAFMEVVKNQLAELEKERDELIGGQEC